MALDKMAWTKWHGQNGTDKILRIKSSINPAPIDNMIFSSISRCHDKRFTTKSSTTKCSRTKGSRHKVHDKRFTTKGSRQNVHDKGFTTKGSPTKGSQRQY